MRRKGWLELGFVSHFKLQDKSLRRLEILSRYHRSAVISYVRLTGQSIPEQLSAR